MTRERAIAARLEAATPGPWEVWADDDDVIGQVVCQMWPKQWKVMRSNAIKPLADTPDPYNNAELIANTRSDLAYLLARVEELERYRAEALSNAVKILSETHAAESRLSEVEGERDAAVEMLRQVTVDWVPNEVFDGDPRCVCSAHRARALLDSFKGSTPGAGEDS